MEAMTIVGRRLEVVAVAPENPKAFEDLKVCRSVAANCELNRGPHIWLSKVFQSWEAEEMSLRVGSAV